MELKMIIDLVERNKVIYYIKFFSSFSFLKKIYELNKKFVEEFEAQLRHPKDNFTNNYDQRRHEKELIMFLYVLDIEEKVLSNFLNNKYKENMYEEYISEDIHSTIFGRYGDERDLENDSFYRELGMQGRDSGWMFQNEHTTSVKLMCIANEFLKFIKITLSKENYEYFMPNHPDLYLKWTYESFNKFLYWNFISDKEISKDQLGLSENLHYEVQTGYEIEVSGIYEPWFELPVYEKLTNDPNYNPHVGCPNYFLNGAIATRYKLEGTEDWYNVKWRLIWEDKRYLDGTIPEEEKAYIFDLENIGVNSTQHYATQKLSVLGGLPCPKEGYWYTLAQEKSHRYFEQGEIFPEIANSAWGKTIWYLEVTNKK